MSLLFLYTLAFVTGFCLLRGLWLAWAPRIEIAARKAGDSPRKNVFRESMFSSLIHWAAELLEGFVTKQKLQRIELKLTQAGRPGGDIKGAEYLGVVWLAAASGFSFLFLMLNISASGFLFSLMFATMAGALIYWLGLVMLDSWVDDRKLLVSRQFPYFLDLSVMIVEAGEDILGAIRIYIRDNPDKELTEELQRTVAEIDLGGTLEEALEHLNARLVSEDIQNTLFAIVQGRRKGTKMADILQNQAESMRFRRSQTAERAAEELKVRLQGPTILMMVSVLLLILGPAILDIAEGGLF